MSKQESKKYETICRLLAREITQKTASVILHLSMRQVSLNKLSVVRNEVFVLGTFRTPLLKASIGFL